MITDEKKKWMDDVGMKEFDQPMKYHLSGGQLFSEVYIENTPLDVLQERHGAKKISEGKE